MDEVNRTFILSTIAACFKRVHFDDNEYDVSHVEMMPPAIPKPLIRARGAAENYT